jgi:maltose-binding protein MalE
MWGISADFGGTFFNSDITQSTFTMPETVAAFQYVWNAIFKDKICPTSTDQQAFGDVGGFPTGLEATTYIGYDAPIGYKDSVKDFKWGVAGLPKGPAGRHAFEGNVGWFVPKGSRYPDMAYELCAYVHGNPELARARAVANSQMVARKDQCHWAYEQFLATVPNIDHAIIDLGGENQDHFPVFPGYQEWGAIWTKWVDPLFVEGNPDVKGQLAGLEKETNDFLKSGWWTKS